MTVVGDRAPRSTHMTETDLLRELEPVVEENLERHLTYVGGLVCSVESVRVRSDLRGRGLGGRHDLAVELADQQLLVGVAEDLREGRGVRRRGHLGLVDLADHVLAQQGDDGLEVVAAGLADPQHRAAHAGTCATTKTRRNGSTVPCGAAG